jgi:cystathionine gamma-synthase
VEQDKLRPESLVVAAGRPHDAGGPLSTPIVLAAPWRHAADDTNAYAREELSPTVRAFEAAVGALEGGTALAFASGMAAVAAVTEGLPAGSVAVVPSAAYSGTVREFADRAQLGQLTVRPVDTTDTDAVSTALDGADLLWLESVSNPLLAVADLPALAAAAHERGALVAVDATFSTPLNLRALDLGADIVMHSATKYLSGHSDVIIGVLVVRSEELAAELHDRRTRTGGIPGALEAYLATRGLRTLALRWERAQANAMTLAERLDAHPRVSRVRYPGLPSDPGHAIAARDHAGFGAIVSFELHGTADDAERLCNAVRVISHATSLGGVESLIERRARHAGDAGFGTPETLLRFSVGIEHVEDLWTDLGRALDEAFVSD